MKQPLAALCLAALAAAGCTKGGGAAGPVAPRSEPRPADPHASVTDPGLAAMTEAASSPSDAAILYDLPSGWTRVKPRSMMRMDQASIPGPAGEGELAVFFFGVGGGGGVQANLDRWAEQIEGGPPVTSSFEQGGYQVSWVETAGTLLPSSMGGVSQAVPNSRLLGGVVEGAGGPGFFKATGPDATITAQKEAFLGMLESIRPNPTAPKAGSF